MVLTYWVTVMIINQNINYNVAFPTDPSRFRLTHENSFVRSHTNSWMENPIIFYTVRIYLLDDISALFQVLMI